MKRNIKFLSFLLAVLLAFSVFPVNTVYAVEGTETVETQKTEEFALPDIVPEEEATDRGYIGRVKEEEKDNYTFVFKDSENMRTMRVYSHPVKYTDKDGNTKDITLDIQSRAEGGFETKDNSIKTTFGAKLSDGIRLQSEDVDIKLIPANSLNQATLSEDSKTVSYTLDTKTTLEYSLTYTGFKEDIVVNEYTGQTEYEFLLYTNGLTVKEEMGSFYLADSEGNRKANIGDIIIFTADERNNTFGELSCIEIKENQIYGLTIHVDAEYLKDEKTVYPIRIDPTLEVTDSESAPIEDVTVYTGTSYYSGTSGVLYIGTVDDKVYRSLMRFPNIQLPSMETSQLISATVELRDLMCQSERVPIECRQYNAIPGMWYESGTTTWSSIGGDTYVGDVLDEQIVYYGNGNVPGISQRYSFDISDEVITWINGTRHPGMGLIFKTRNIYELGATSGSTVDRLKYFGSYNRSDYKPSLTIIYGEIIVTTSIAMSQTVARGIKDGYIHLAATIAPQQVNPVSWSSSDVNIATVSDSGVVHLRSLGVATITASTLDIYNNVITAQCVVHCCIPDGEYFIENVSSGKYVDVIDGTAAIGKRLVQKGLERSITQKWKITYNTSGSYYTIKSSVTTGNYYMGVSSDLTSNNVTITLRNSVTTNGAKWLISESSDGNYIFTAKTGEAGGRVLNVYNNSNSDGALLEQYTYTDNADASDEWLLYETKITYVHYFDSTLLENDTMVSYIEDANAFAAAVFNRSFGVEFVCEGEPNYFADAVADDCPLDGEECNSSCFASCDGHHKNILRMSNQLYNMSTREPNHVYVLWATRDTSEYCIEYYGMHIDLYTYVGQSQVFGAVVDYRPVINFYDLTCEDNELLALMSINLAHETVHTFGAPDVYDSQNHDIEGQYHCIMEYVEPELAYQFYQEVMYNGESALCDECMDTLEALVNGYIHK